MKIRKYIKPLSSFSKIRYVGGASSFHVDVLQGIQCEQNRYPGGGGGGVTPLKGLNGDVRPAQGMFFGIFVLNRVSILPFFCLKSGYRFYQFLSQKGYLKLQQNLIQVSRGRGKPIGGLNRK